MTPSETYLAKAGAREVLIAVLQERLHAGGAVIETPTRLVATGRDDWSANRR